MRNDYYDEIGEQLKKYDKNRKRVIFTQGFKVERSQAKNFMLEKDKCFSEADVILDIYKYFGIQGVEK